MRIEVLENRFMIENNSKVPFVLLEDDHLAHIFEHYAILYSEKHRKNKRLKKSIKAHCDQHMELLHLKRKAIELNLFKKLRKAAVKFKDKDLWKPKKLRKKKSGKKSKSKP